MKLIIFKLLGKFKIASCIIHLLAQILTNGTILPNSSFSLGRDVGAQFIQWSKFSWDCPEDWLLMACLRKLMGHRTWDTLAAQGEREPLWWFGMEVTTFLPLAQRELALTNLFLPTSPYLFHFIPISGEKLHHACNDLTYLSLPEELVSVYLFWAIMGSCVLCMSQGH